MQKGGSGKSLAGEGPEAQADLRRKAGRKSLIVSVFLIVLICLAAVVVIYTVHKNNEKIDRPRLQSFFNSNACSQKDLDAVKHEKPTPKDIEGSIYLLGFRAECYDRLGNYQESMANYRLLKTYYMMQHNNKMISIVDSEISGVQANIDYFNNNKTKSSQ